MEQTLSQTLIRAMQRRQQGNPQPMLNQVSAQAPSFQGAGIPTPVTTDATGMRDQPQQKLDLPQQAKAQNNEDIIIKSLTDYLKNSQKLGQTPFL